jgi:hypothetical protein
MDVSVPSLTSVTHRLNAPGFNPLTYKLKNRFQAFAFKFNLYRYTVEPSAGGEAVEFEADVVLVATGMVTWPILAVTNRCF